jgi:hypothetical protein
VQKCDAAFGEATDWLDAPPVDDRAFVARVAGPFVDVLKDVVVNCLNMRLVEFSLRAVAFVSAMRKAVARYSSIRNSE